MTPYDKRLLLTSKLSPMKQRHNMDFPDPRGPITWHWYTLRVVCFLAKSSLFSLVTGHKKHTVFTCWTQENTMSMQYLIIFLWHSGHKQTQCISPRQHTRKRDIGGKTNDRGKVKYLEKNQPQCHPFLPQMSHRLELNVDLYHETPRTAWVMTWQIQDHT